MLYLGTLITAASGRLNGSVFSRNRGGPYIKAWVQPDETPTTERQAVWDAMASLAASWPGLSVAQRALWQSYSLTTPRPNRIGIPRPVGGRQEYFRANLIRLQANNLLGTGFPTVGNPPASSAPNPTSPPTFSCLGGDPFFTAHAAHPAQYSSDSEAAVAVWISETRPETTLTYHGTWTLVGATADPFTHFDGDTYFFPGFAPIPLGFVAYVRTRYFDEFGNLREPCIYRLVPS